MTRPEIEDRAQILLAQIYFNHLDVKDIYSWVQLLRSNAYDSSKINLLLDNTTRTDQEIIRLFLELKKELEIPITNDPEAFYRRYALEIAVQYLNKEMKVQNALHKILLIIQEAEDKDHYLPFVDFCIKHDILKPNLKFKNVRTFRLTKAMKELDAIFLLFAENSHKLKLRIELEQRSTAQLIKARYLNAEVYDKLSLIIIDDILLDQKVSRQEIKSIINKLKKQRR